MSDIVELKNLITSINTAFEEFKRTNDAIQKGFAKGDSVVELSAKLDRITADLEKMTEAKALIEQFMLKSSSPGGIGGGDKDLALEVKLFNTALRADYQAKGKSMPIEFDGAGYTMYKSAFFKMIGGHVLDNLSSDERKALSAGSDPDGGYMLPASTIGMIVKKQFDQSVMRQICDVVSISTGKTGGVVDNDEADAGWTSEMGTRSNTDTPQVGKWEIEPQEMYALPKATQTLIDDAVVDIETWLAGKVADKFARVEGTAFWTGNGVGKPRGLGSYTTAATADGTRTWGEHEHVLSGANGAFHTTKFDPIHDLQGAFKEHYLVNATFCMTRGVRTAARKLKDLNDRYLWEPSSQIGQPDRLNGFPVRTDEHMAALATGSLSLALGDFKQAYQIVDRIGIRTLRDPFTAKPYIVFYTTKRVGGGALNYEAVKFIKFAAA
jgi:HK97 family phage major capsid protein